MGWNKRQLVAQALEEIGLSPHAFDIAPEQWQSALRTMDAMLALWDASGLSFGYALPANADDSDLDEEAGIPDTTVEAVYLNLARRLAPRFGKVVSEDTKTNGKIAYDALVNAFAGRPPQMQYPSGMLRGAGNKCPTRPFMSEPTDDALSVGDNDSLVFGD